MTEVRIKTITFAAIAALTLGAELDGGKFAGITTLKDGTHCAVVLLSGGQLPTRPVAALLYANAKDQFEETWYWTSETLDADTGDEDDASYAWFCYFYYGDQYYLHKSAAGACVAVRLIPLNA